MAQIKVRINPKTEIIKSKAWKSAIRKAQDKSKQPVNLALQKVSPVDTGLLRDSWDIKDKNFGLDIRNTTPYGSFVNDGTKYQKAQKFTEKAIPKIENIYEKEIIKAIEDIK